jgi:hypothetical protein
MADKPTLTLNQYNINTMIFEAEESNNGYTSTDIRRVIRSKRMGRAGHVACIGEIIFVSRGIKVVQQLW